MIEEADVERIVAEVEHQIGGVDILVVNATPDQPHLPIEEYDWDFYQSMLDFFIKSPFLLSRAVLPHMKKQGWGRMINITSGLSGLVLAGMLAGEPMPSPWIDFVMLFLNFVASNTFVIFFISFLLLYLSCCLLSNVLY